MLSTIPLFRPNPSALVRRITDLPPAPKILHRLRKMVTDPNASLDQIAVLIAMEPSLSAKVIRMANSVHFGGNGQISSIAEAMQRVGMDGVQEVVTFAIASSLVGQTLKTYGLDANTLWFRAIACALAAKGLAEHSGIDPNEAYTAGLLHGIGLLVIDRYIRQERSSRIFESSGYPVDFAPDEYHFFGYTHADAGAALLELWEFSEPIVEAVRCQMSPESSANHRKLCMTLATARWARSLFCVPEEKIPELPCELWLEEAGIQIPDFNSWLNDIRRGYTIAKHELRLS